MNEKQKLFEEKYGPPEEFVVAIWLAYLNLVITDDEAIAAIKKYRKEWNNSKEVKIDESLSI